MAAYASYEGWDFLDDGSMRGPAGQVYDQNLNQIADGSSPFFSTLTSFLTYAGKAGVDTYTAKIRTQQGIDGQRYIEGQRLKDDMTRYQMQYGLGGGGSIGMMPLLLLGGLAVVGLLISKS